jgi:hypothetical protein
MYSIVRCFLTLSSSDITVGDMTDSDMTGSDITGKTNILGTSQMIPYIFDLYKLDEADETDFAMKFVCTCSY